MMARIEAWLRARAIRTGCRKLERMIAANVAARNASQQVKGWKTRRARL